MKITPEDFESAMSEALNCDDERAEQWDELINSPLLRRVVRAAEHEYRSGDKTIETLVNGFLVIGMVLGARHALDGLPLTPADREALQQPKKPMPKTVRLIGFVYTSLCIIIGLCIGLSIHHFTH